MTDKELISIVDAKAKKLWNEINTGHEYSIIDSYNQFYGICIEIAEMVQEEPVSNALEEELDKYIKDNFTIDKEQLDRFGIKEKDYMYSMDKSDMLRMIRYFIGKYKVPESDDLDEAAKLHVADSLCITNEDDWDDAAIEALNMYKAGAKWQEEQDQETIELAEDHAMLAGMEKMKEQMTAKAIDARCFGFQGDALFSFRLPADNYLVGSEVKVIVVKED